jgi:DNA mismatch endonuclease, patch repair protein
LFQLLIDLEPPLVDRITKEKRSKIMSAIHSKNTKPEINLRRVLWKKGLRYRIHYGKEKIDIAFPSTRVAVFVDGCFWHGCPIHSHLPKSNKEYWLPKLKKNMERDKETTKRLWEDGWKVLRFWEHELMDIQEVIEQIEIALPSK